MKPSTLLTEWSRLLIGSLRRAGVRDVVLSPGSRSTPFTWAALRDPGLRCRTIVDERSAAFFAVGHARMTGDPVLLVCTSGSAAANYFPAVVEAAEAGVPLLVLSADRPLELQAAAAPQTIDQVKLYGDYARAYFELGAPDPDSRMLRAIPRLAAQAVLASRWPVPGPVQLNARARKPLEPREPAGPEEEALRRAVDRWLDGVPLAPPPEVAPAGTALDGLADACRSARRGLIVCGPAVPAHAAAPEAIARLAAATGFPVVAEAASQLRFAGPDAAATLDALGSLLEVPGFAAAHQPDLLLQVGRPPTASAWHAAFEIWEETPRYVLASHGWPDPWNSAAGVIQAPLTATLGALADRLEGAGPSAPGGDWEAGLREANDDARAVLHDALRDGFPEGAAVRAVVERLPRNAVLVVGNSLPIREVDSFVGAGDRGLTVSSQRGANGIDGLISGAAGAAAATARPTTLLLGDVSFLHDLGGLAAARDLPAPLAVVVLNNGGGRIFERLPIAETLEAGPERDAWLTPTGLSVAAAAEAFGLPYARATDAASLGRALDAMDALAANGRSGVLEVVVPDGGTTAHQRAVVRALGALGG